MDAKGEDIVARMTAACKALDEVRKHDQQIIFDLRLVTVCEIARESAAASERAAVLAMCEGMKKKCSVTCRYTSACICGAIEYNAALTALAARLTEGGKDA